MKNCRFLPSQIKYEKICEGRRPLRIKVAENKDSDSGTLKVGSVNNKKTKLRES